MNKKWSDRLVFSLSIDEMHFCDIVKENQMVFPFADHTENITVQNAQFIYRVFYSLN